MENIWNYLQILHIYRLQVYKYTVSLLIEKFFFGTLLGAFSQLALD